VNLNIKLEINARGEKKKTQFNEKTFSVIYEKSMQN